MNRNYKGGAEGKLKLQGVFLGRRKGKKKFKICNATTV